METEKFYKHNGIAFSVRPCVDQMLETGIELYVGHTATNSKIKLPNAIYGQDRHQVIETVKQQIDKLMDKLAKAEILSHVQVIPVEKDDEYLI